MNGGGWYRGLALQKLPGLIKPKAMTGAEQAIISNLDQTLGEDVL